MRNHRTHAALLFLAAFALGGCARNAPTSEVTLTQARSHGAPERLFTRATAPKIASGRGWTLDANQSIELTMGALWLTAARGGLTVTFPFVLDTSPRVTPTELRVGRLGYWNVPVLDVGGGPSPASARFYEGRNETLFANTNTPGILRDRNGGLLSFDRERAAWVLRTRDRVITFGTTCGGATLRPVLYENAEGRVNVAYRTVAGVCAPGRLSEGDREAHVEGDASDWSIVDDEGGAARYFFSEERLVRAETPVEGGTLALVVSWDTGWPTEIVASNGVAALRLVSFGYDTRGKTIAFEADRGRRLVVRDRSRIDVAEMNGDVVASAERPQLPEQR